MGLVIRVASGVPIRIFARLFILSTATGSVYPLRMEGLLPLQCTASASGSLPVAGATGSELGDWYILRLGSVCQGQPLVSYILAAAADSRIFVISYY